MKRHGWRPFCAVVWMLLVAVDPTASSGQELRRDVEPGKYLAFRGYVVQEDTVICRTPEKERELAALLIRLNTALDELDLLREESKNHAEQMQILKRMIARRDFVIQKQDSLIQQLEKLTFPRREGFLNTLGRIFDRRTFFLIGFVTGVFAGVRIQ